MPNSTLTSLSHLVIFNPTLRPTIPEQYLPDGSRDKDLEDDLREAGQILFYTSRKAGGVSRDTMLRQVGLVKGLMGFNDMVLGPNGESWWSVHGHRSRMIIYSPEKDFYMYMHVELAHSIPEAGESSGTSKMRGEPLLTAQGLSDRMIVDCLKAAHEDFCLLHGPLSTAPTSSVMDKFWTRFAFSFEARFLSVPTPSPTLLNDWIGGYPPPPDELVSATRNIESLQLFKYGILNSAGPIVSPNDSDPALTRFLMSKLEASLPPPIEPPKIDGRQSLGFGLRKKEGGRKASWNPLGSLASGWVPGLGSRSTTPTGHAEGKEERARWPSFGLSGLGLGEAVGSVGEIFGLGHKSQNEHKTPADTVNTVPLNRAKEEDRQSEIPPEDKQSEVSPEDKPGDEVLPEEPHVEQSSVEEPQVEASSVEESHIEQSSVEEAHVEQSSNEETQVEQSSVEQHHVVEQSSVAIRDLEAAVSSAQVELEWDGRKIYLSRDDYSPSRVSWIIDLPSTQTTLNLFAVLSAAAVATQLSRPLQDISSMANTIPTNSTIYTRCPGFIQISGPEIDPASSHTLSELKDTLASDMTIGEIYARTSTGRFVVAKRGESTQQVYMLVGRKDASLTDAEHAMRSFARGHAEFA